MDPRRRIAELTDLLARCEREYRKHDAGARRLKRIMAGYIDEKNKLELAIKGDASSVESDSL